MKSSKTISPSKSTQYGPSSSAKENNLKENYPANLEKSDSTDHNKISSSFNKSPVRMENVSIIQRLETEIKEDSGKKEEGCLNEMETAKLSFEAEENKKCMEKDTLKSDVRDEVFDHNLALSFEDQEDENKADCKGNDKVKEGDKITENNSTTYDGNKQQIVSGILNNKIPQSLASTQVNQKEADTNESHSFDQTDEVKEASGPLKALRNKEIVGNNENQPFSEQNIKESEPFDPIVVKDEENSNKSENKITDSGKPDELEKDLADRLDRIDIHSSITDDKQTKPENINENASQKKNDSQDDQICEKKELESTKILPTLKDEVGKEKNIDSDAKDVALSKIEENKETKESSNKDSEVKIQEIKGVTDLEGTKILKENIEFTTFSVKIENTEDIPPKNEKNPLIIHQERENRKEIKGENTEVPKKNINQLEEKLSKDINIVKKRLPEKEHIKVISDKKEEKKQELKDQDVKKSQLSHSTESKISGNIKAAKPTLKARDWTSRQPVENDETEDLKAGKNQPTKVSIIRTSPAQLKPKPKLMQPAIIKTRPPISTKGSAPLHIITDVKASVKVSHSTTVVDQLGAKFGHLGLSTPKRITSSRAITSQMEKLSIQKHQEKKDGCPTQSTQRLEQDKKPSDERKFTARGETAPGGSPYSQSESPHTEQARNNQSIPQPDMLAASANFPQGQMGKKRHIDENNMVSSSTKRFESANGYLDGIEGFDHDQNGLSYSDDLLDDLSDPSSPGILYMLSESSHTSSPLSHLGVSPPPSPTLLEPINEIQNLLKSFTSNSNVAQANSTLLGVHSPQASESTQLGSPQSYMSSSSHSPASQPQPLSPPQYQHGSPLYQQQGSPALQQHGSPLYQQQQSSPAVQQQGSPLYLQQQSSPALQQQASPLYQQQQSSSLAYQQQQGSPVYQQPQGSPSNPQRSPLQQTNSPQYYRIPSPAGSVQGSALSPQSAGQVTLTQPAPPATSPATFLSTTPGSFGVVEVKTSVANMASLLQYPLHTGPGPAYPKNALVPTTNRRLQQPSGYNRQTPTTTPMQFSSVYRPLNVCRKPFMPPQPGPVASPSSCRFSNLPIFTNLANNIKPEHPADLPSPQVIQQPQHPRVQQWPQSQVPQHPSLSFTREQLLHQDEDGDTFLHIAISQGNIELARLIANTMYKYDASSLNTEDDLGQTPLAVAMVTGCDKLVEHLLQLRASPDPVTRDGDRPLHLAVRYGHFKCVLAFTSNVDNIDFDVKNYEGLTALHLAVIEHGKKKELEDDKMMIVNNRQCVQILIEMGASPFCEDGKSGKTPLHYAVEQVDYDLVSIILDNTEDSAKLTNCTNYSGNTALHIVVGIPNKDEKMLLQIINLLMRHGVEVGLCNSDKHPAIALVDCHHNEIKKKLRSGQTGFKVNGQANHKYSPRFNNKNNF